MISTSFIRFQSQNWWISTGKWSFGMWCFCELEKKGSARGLIDWNFSLGLWQARRDADDLKVAITGSEIVGLIPLRALLQAADYYVQKEKLMILHEDQKVHLAINRLGLSSLHNFNPKQVLHLHLHFNHDFLIFQFISLSIIIIYIFFNIEDNQLNHLIGFNWNDSINWSMIIIFYFFLILKIINLII